MPAADTASKPTRVYRSPRRQEQARRTRERIVAAATEQFLAHGYAATTMRAVATTAEVALPTVELAFGAKAHLLKAAIDVATAGDDEPVPMLQRAWATRAQATTEAGDFLAVFGAVFRRSAERAAGLALVAFEAPPTDPEIQAVTRQLASQREVMATWIVDGVMRRSRLRAGISRKAAVDTVWLLMDPAVFCRLTRDRGWTPVRFGQWFTDSTARLLLPSPTEPTAAARITAGGITAGRAPRPDHREKGRPR